MRSTVGVSVVYGAEDVKSTVHALQKNLATLAARRTGDVDGLPCGQTSMADFKQVIGWQALEERQARYELG